jgi:hypothetical protein
LENTITLCIFIKEKNYKDGDLKGMKSHDFHVVLRDILFLCLQHLMVEGCRMAIMCLSHVFKKLYAKIVDWAMGDLKNDVAIFLVLLEKEFMSSFFDIMMHLLVHLVEELESMFFLQIPQVGALVRIFDII